MFILPDPQDAESVAGDYLSLFLVDQDMHLPPNRRKAIVSNCITPLRLVIEAGEMVNALDAEEKQILVCFMTALVMQTCNTQNIH